MIFPDYISALKRQSSRWLRGCAVAAAAMMASTVTASAADFKIALDSAEMEMGRINALHLTIDGVDATVPSDVILPLDSMRMIEFVNADNLPRLAPTDLPDRLAATYKIQVFDSGEYVIPPVLFVNADGDSVFSNSLTLKVNPVDVSKEEDIRAANTSPEDLGSKWYDWLPGWIIDNWLLIILGIIVIAGAICAYLIYTKRLTIKLIPTKKPEPPYNVAIRKLEELRTEQLWEKGQDKSYYTRLTDILREYLDHRFGINAMEMTSSQILQAIAENDDTSNYRTMLESILSTADFVKFAKVKPTPVENVHSFDSVVRFVEETKPAPDLDKEDEGDEEDSENEAGEKKSNNNAGQPTDKVN